MVRLDRITTRGGDLGETSLADGTRLSKADPAIEALGAVDEANAAIGALRLHTRGSPHDALLGRIQNDLFDVGADLAVPMVDDEAPGSRLRIEEGQLASLDDAIASLNATLPPLTSFVLPGGTPSAVHAHLARTLTRRAERAVVATRPGNPLVVRYLNRLSDLLFVLGRVLNDQGKEDVLWVPGANRSK